MPPTNRSVKKQTGSASGAAAAAGLTPPTSAKPAAAMRTAAAANKKPTKKAAPVEEPEEEEEEAEEEAEDDAAEEEEDAAPEELDAEQEEDEEDAEAAAEDDEAGEDDADLGEDEEDDEMTEEDLRLAAEEDAAEAAAGEDGEDEEDADGPAVPRASKSPHALVLGDTDADAYTAAMANRGVVYLSRIPPYMKAAKLRWLLEQMIPATKKARRIGRIFLTPEDVSAARRRKKAGGNSGKKFVDGWVEFESKKVARWLADTYNAQPMGGPKRNRYAEDLWTLKYLKGFKWNHLTEKIAYEKQIRGTKIREEMSQAKRESEYYLGQVDRSQKADRASTKRRRDDKDVGGDEGRQKKAHTGGPVRTFHQRSLIDQKKGGKTSQ